MDFVSILSSSVHKMLQPNVGTDPEVLLNKLFVYITEPLDMNFDSAFLYLTKNPDDLGIPIGESSSTEFLVMIKTIIERQLMTENIRNDSNRIHFRSFVNNVTLDTKHNTIRIKIFMVAAETVGFDRVLKFLVHKLVQTRSKKSKLLKVSDDLYDLSVTEFRLRSVIHAIRQRKHLSVRTGL